MNISVHFNASDNKIVSLVVITTSYLRFSYAFRPRRESATFLFATMVIACPNSSTHVWWCSSLSRGGWNRAIFARYYAHEDFGTSNKHVGLYFQSTFHIREYSIWATNHYWKVLWKHGPTCLFDLPKSSFGDHKVNTAGTHALLTLLMRCSAPYTIVMMSSCYVDRYRDTQSLRHIFMLHVISCCEFACHVSQLAGTQAL